MDAARHHLDALCRLAPGITVRHIANAQPAKDPMRIAALVEGLRLAGMPAE